MRSMFGVWYPIMPRLLWLMFQVPMSSPQITRMFGLSAANAPDTASTAATTHVNFVAIRRQFTEAI